MLDGPRSVNDLVAVTKLKQPNVSNHLARLRRSNIVQTSKVGRQIFYSVATADLETTIRSFLSIKNPEKQDVDLISAAKEYAKFAVRGKERQCGEILERVLHSTKSVIDIYQDFIGAAMGTVGLWYKVEAIDISEEHMASEITQRMLVRISQYYGSSPANGLKAILACPPDNWHTIGLRVLGDYLKFCGWDVLFVGANTPTNSLIKTVSEEHPDLVLLSCNATEGLDSLETTVSQLCVSQEAPLGFAIGVGGAAVGESLDRMKKAGADFYAKDLRTFAETFMPVIEKKQSN
jgi:MerR family transcriptional regulator, light-induced transcriptional regulator